MRRFLQDMGRTHSPQVWEVSCKGNAVTVTWGQLGGAMQKTTQTFEAVNVGKANEKPPKQVAQEWAERQILLRTRKGYYEVNPQTNKPLKAASSSDMNFNRLPEHLRFFKPQNSMNAHCEKLICNQTANLLRKRDGMMHVITVGESGVVNMYSSTMQECHKDEPGVLWVNRYPELIKELTGLDLPPRTILLGELCTTASAGFRDRYGMPVDDFAYVESITKSLTPLALEKQKARGPLGYCIWDIAYLDGVCVLQEWAAESRFSLIKDLLNRPNRRHVTMPEMAYFTDNGLIVESLDAGELVMDYLTADMVNEVSELAKTFGWEGWVVVDPNSTYGDRAFSFHGKPERPKFVCKLKPTLEADFIVRWDPDNGVGKRGKGKKSKGIGSVELYLWDPDQKEEVFICYMGGGLTDKQVIELAKPELYPMIWEISFASWTPKGALRHPNLERIRQDKGIEECLINQRPHQ